MRYALDDQGNRITTYKGARATCPMCGEKVRARHRKIEPHRWQHQDHRMREFDDDHDCDHWAEPLTFWHETWLDMVPPSQQEVITARQGERHRVDLVTARGDVVLLRRSEMSLPDVWQREEFYGERMVWIVDLGHRDHPLDPAPFQIRQGAVSREMLISWRRGPIWLSGAMRPVYLDLGDGRYARIERSRLVADLVELRCRPISEEWLIDFIMGRPLAKINPPST